MGETRKAFFADKINVRLCGCGGNWVHSLTFCRVRGLPQTVKKFGAK